MTYEPERPDARYVTDAEPTVFEQYPIASWQAEGGTKIAFPITDLTEGGGKRIVERERPYRDGAKLDDTGRKATRWTMVAYFDNTIEEPGLEANGGAALYPDVLNDLIDSFSINGTGDLVVPTRGPVRARLEDYNRSERVTARNCAALNLVFVEDNEDTVDAASLSAPTVSANAVRLAETTEFSAQADGAWDGSIQDLAELAANLEGLANAPANAWQDLESQANSVMASADRVTQAFSNPTIPGRGMFVDDPDSGQTQRKIAQTKELAGKTRTSAKRNQPRLSTVVFESDQSVASIAAMLALDFMVVLQVNPQIADPLYVPAGTVVRIPVDGEITRQG